ncbi:MAG: sigma 54-interacting transcriptional regulator [Acidobacteriaceae bacterium]|nr:sigma 54-interacting transcriptional regulator [Acidobacteriaceae bacterium]
MSSNSYIPAASFRHPVAEVQERESLDASPLSGSGIEQRDSVLLGDSAAIRRLRSQIQRIAPYFRTALISGEVGSGKQLVGRALHALSPGADGPFIVANATAIAESVANAESPRSTSIPSAPALLESASGGTLYIDGVGSLPFSLQDALFRFLRLCEERRAILRSDNHPLAIQIIASSDRDLRTLSAIGQFRQDLYVRISAVEVFVPPLRQRIEDIPILSAWLLRRLANQFEQSPKLLTEATIAQLQSRLWPNNLCELERAVAQAAALAEGAIIEPRHLLALAEPAAAPLPTARIERLQDIIQHHVLDVLTRCGGNKLRAAELLGISRSTLYRMLDASSPTIPE